MKDFDIEKLIYHLSDMRKHSNSLNECAKRSEDYIKKYFDDLKKLPTSYRFTRLLENLLQVLEEEFQPDNDYEKKITYLEFSVRTHKCLIKANIFYVKDLVHKTENDLLKLENFGHKSLYEVKNVLGEMGFRLGMNFDYEF